MHVRIPTLCKSTGVKGLALSAECLGIILYSLSYSGFFEVFRDCNPYHGHWPMACVKTRSCLLFVANREENHDTCHRRTPELIAVAVLRNQEAFCGRHLGSVV